MKRPAGILLPICINLFLPYWWYYELTMDRQVLVKQHFQIATAKIQVDLYRIIACDEEFYIALYCPRKLWVFSLSFVRYSIKLFQPIAYIIHEQLHRFNQKKMWVQSLENYRKQSQLSRQAVLIEYRSGLFKNTQFKMAHRHRKL